MSSPPLDIAELDARLRAGFDTLEADIFNHTDSLYERVYDSLVVSKAPEKADAIFVFGSPNDPRIRKAVELHNDKLANRIIISGQ